MMGRFGSMVAPQTPLLVGIYINPFLILNNIYFFQAKYNKNAPAILFATTAIVSACLSLLFPETTNLILPTTMKEADNIGASKEKESSLSQNATSIPL